MGSVKSSEKPKRRGRPLGKINASLNEKLGAVKWGEFKIGDLFEVKSSKKIYHANQLDIKEKQFTGYYPYIARTTKNNGIRGYIKKDKNTLNDSNTLSFAQDTFTVYYQNQRYYTGNKVKVLKPKFDNVNDRTMRYIVACFQTTLKHFSWGTGSTTNSIQELSVRLPIKNDGSINFNFMESFIAELEAERVAELSAYLKVSGLDNYELSDDEKDVVVKFQKRHIPFAEFEFMEIFNNIKQGRRLKKDDQVPGNIPFVMSGTTNTGVIGCVSNPVALFPKNSITIDIFGNSFYRNYDFGAGDDTGVYWSTINTYSKASMLFFTAASQKALCGKYSYGKKLRSSQSLHFKMQLPVKDGKPDYETMETLISAIQKSVVKDVALYADKKIETTKYIIDKQ